MNVKSLSSSAMRLDLQISTYTGRTQDKATASEVNISKGARSSRASSVYKSLFVDDADLEAIVSYTGQVRTWLYLNTLPWSDGGTRLVPTKSFFNITRDLDTHNREFTRLVNNFVNNYGTKIAAQAFKLGRLFDATEFPTAGEVAGKFGFNYHFTPVPSAGDFRVDIQSQAVDQLKAQFEKAQIKQLGVALQEPWQRLYKEVGHIRDKMVDHEDGKAKKLYQSMLDNALGLCETLRVLNVFDDPELEEARRALELSLTDIDIKSLRESKDMRDSIKIKMDELADKFNMN